jgi:hypothetical protein
VAWVAAARAAGLPLRSFSRKHHGIFLHHALTRAHTGCREDHTLAEASEAEEEEVLVASAGQEVQCQVVRSDR